MKIFQTFTNWLFPHRCASCSTEIADGAVVCAKCFSELVFVAQPFCEKCGKILAVSNVSEMLCETCTNYPREFTLCRSLFVYNYQSQHIIMKIKNQAASDIAKTCIKMLMSRYFEIFNQGDIIIPVPSHWSRVARRGYNPAEIIARELATFLHKQCFSKYLKKAKRTEYQKNKNISDRKHNVHQSFVCRKNLQNKSIILVDDILTTGATLNEATRVLMLAGAKNVLCITICTTESF